MPGLYVHVPFCVKKCAYCSFYSVTRLEMMDKFQKALIIELESRCKGRKPATLYVGGGTPAIVSPEYWSRFIRRLKETADTSGLQEMTIEANPDTVTAEKLADLRQAGFNRLSMGVQSFHDDLLGTLGRVHDSERAAKAFEAASGAGFSNVSIDLIYGIPGQTLSGWMDDLEKAVELAPDHMSCYQLSLEKGTPLFDSVKKGLVSKPSRGTAADMYFAAHEHLVSCGFHHYEVSSYAGVEGKVSRHNSAYWERKPYTGLGPSAHSFDGARSRSWNVDSVSDYVERLCNGESPEMGKEELTKEQSAMETIMLGLRTSQGFDIVELKALTGFGVNTEYLKEMVRQGHAKIHGDVVRSTPRGMLYADGNAVSLLSSIGSFD